MTKAQGVPEGWHSLTPRIVAADAGALVRFLEVVFGASAERRTGGPWQVRMGDSLVMVSAAGVRPPFPAFLYVYVEDADAAYQRALGAGAISIEDVVDTPYGDRRGMVQDPHGNVWQIATHRSLPEPKSSTT